jgi:TnpA family transposase
LDLFGEGTNMGIKRVANANDRYGYDELLYVRKTGKIEDDRIEPGFGCFYSFRSREVQREVHEGLNVVENWNATNDFICYGRQGELATNSREQQEVVTLSLQLLQNCLVLVNTLLVERTIEREGLWERLTADDLRALTPLFHGHINPYGQFALDLARPSFLEAA